MNLTMIYKKELYDLAFLEPDSISSWIFSIGTCLSKLVAKNYKSGYVSEELRDLQCFHRRPQAFVSFCSMAWSKQMYDDLTK
jgi:hypothetical protein